MKVELLFPEIANQFGDLGNMRYLARCLPQAEFCDTHLGEEPRFLREPVNLVYLGPMSEQGQEKVLEVLRPHRFALQKQLQEGTPFLFTGNALELLGERIENEDGTRVEGLGLFPLTARRDMLHRHNSIFLGSFEGEPVMGYKSQFTMAYPGDKSLGLFLREQIPFGQIPVLVERALGAIPVQLNPSLEDILEADRAARQVVCDSRKDG